jgi:ATP-dependent phosphofructokinase / diphosphate-dependent phosphofructokinase
MRIGVLTGGGDCPGLNAVIRAVVRRAEVSYGDGVVGFLDGWAGVVENRWIPLDVGTMRGMLPRGGTLIGTSRTTPLLLDGGLERAAATAEALGIDGLIVIGGDGTLGAAQAYGEFGGRVVGVPKTIDNDVAGTDMTFGFNTAVQTATELIDRLHTTAESHDRVMVVEVMGRHVGHVAVHAGMAGGATAILVPEHPFDIEELCERLRRRHEAGRFASIVVVAEGAMPKAGNFELPPAEIDQWGHDRLGGIGRIVGDEISRRTGFETRVTVLGHVQRGGTPTAFDRVLCTRFGVAAVDALRDMIESGDEHAPAQMVALRGTDITIIALSDVVGVEKMIDDSIWETARVFFA